MSDVWARAAAAFAFTGTVTPLVGERTDNAAVAGPDGEPVAVLKLHQPADRDDIELEVAALQHLSVYPGLRGRMPQVVPSVGDTPLVEISTPDGVRLARALTWLPGRTWRPGDVRPDRLAALGRLVAELDQALASFDHAGSGRRLRWNLVEAGSVAGLVEHVGDPERQEAAGAVLGGFESDLAPRLAALPAQVVHNDANPANIVLSTRGASSSSDPELGLIDFGDICRAPRICGLAVALAYAVGSALADDPAMDPASDLLAVVVPLVAGYHQVAPLAEGELELLLPLARTRLAVSVVMAAWQHSRDPDNHYLLAAQGEVWPALQRLLAVDDHLALCRVREAVGLEPCPRSAAVREYLRSIDVAPVLGRPLTELGYEIMDWSGPEVPPPPEVTGERVLVGRYLEDRAVYTTDAFATPAGERRTVHLAVDLFRPPGSPVHAPLDGVVELCGDNAAPLDYGPVVVLRHVTPDGQPFFTLYGHLSRATLDGVRPGLEVAAGEVFARIGVEAENGGWAPHLHLQLLTDLVGLGLDVPGVAARSEMGLWASLSPDPGLLLDLPGGETAASDPDQAAALELECAALAHLAAVAPDLPVPRVVSGLAGETVAWVRTGRGEHVARMVTLPPGQPMPGWDDERAAELVGATCARVSVALQGFFHPAAGPVPTDAASPAMAALPAWVQHPGITPATLFVDEADRLSGIVGFDGLRHAPAVTALATTIAGVLAGAAETRSDPWHLAAAVVHGYQRHRPLSLAEVDLLGELVQTRAPGLLEATAPEELRRLMRRMAGLGAPGLPGAAPSAVAGLLSRRRAVQGGALSPLFYSRPLDIVAGEGVWLMDRYGRRYLDGYNNVAVVGHSHPRVAQAITRQVAVLHTHNRYLHPNPIELAERLVASMPAGSGLDTCLFTTSGTEANELAWRLAVEYTGGDGAIIGSHAYHGASKFMADLSSNEWPPGYRPLRVATFEGPVQHESMLTRLEGLARISSAATDLALAGHRSAMVIADSLFTSEGVRVATPEFMTGMVEGAHAAGALYVADEVQVGFGRTGPQLWRFAALGIRPDVVTLGKPMGAGYPIGALVTRREIADALAARYEYFSTFAANPVATAAGLAVLDVIEDDDLGGRAVELGERLRVGVRALQERYPAIGQVRGVGLIAGIDLPSPDAATAVVEGLKDRGVLVGRTGRRGDVLKVRPPLVWHTEHVELFLRALEAVLAESVVG